MGRTKVGLRWTAVRGRGEHESRALPGGEREATAGTRPNGPGLGSPAVPQRLHVPDRYRRGHGRTEEESVESGVVLLGYLAECLGRSSLAGVDLLDVGCGVKLTQAILERDLPIGTYTGIDIAAPIIDYLRGAVEDPRFEFHHLDGYNERYNPGGQPLTTETDLGVGQGRTFDLLSAFSVFTHLEPGDFRVMLQLLRPAARPGGRFLLSLYLDERSAGGHGLMDNFAAAWGDDAVGRTERYRDLKPDKPLQWALYSRAYALELVEGTGWDVVAVGDPRPDIQHTLTLAPC